MEGRDRAMVLKRFAALALVVVLATLPLAAAFERAPSGTGGAVASNDPAATAVGLDILRSGGNAVDAAVATALALAVVFPEAGNLGGGGFAVIKRGDDLRTLDFRETAPTAAARAMYLDEHGEPRPEASTLGPLAAGVPGSPAGLYELHRTLGSLPWERVVAPAERLASEGFLVGRHLRSRLENPIDRARLARFPETAGVWLTKDGEPLTIGTRIRQEALARTLAAYRREGPDAITAGPVAAAIEGAAKRHGGVLTAADLARYRPVWRAPLRFEAFGWSFASMALPSSGGVILAQTFGLLERLGWPRLPRFGAERAHQLAESFRRAYADRFLLGDPTTSLASPADLLDPAWLDRRAGSIAPGHATPSDHVGSWTERERAAAADKPDTTHVSVIDRDGNLVALTTTLNDLFGCALYVPEIGFLNNEMDDFTAVPGRPNLFGLIQGEANAIAPGKRMLSSMAPTIAWRGEEAIAIGGRGGSRIPTNVAQVLLALIVDGDGLAAALGRARLHHQWLPDLLEVEADALAPETRAELERRGHTVEVPKTDKFARIFAVRRTIGGRLEAAGDPRGPSGAGAVEPEF